jgi:hypothetical protein
MDAGTADRGKKKLKICTEKKKDVAFGSTLEDLDPGAPCYSTWKLALEGPGHHHHDPRRHPELGFSFWRHI